jgi:altronate hydrolase
VATTTALFEKMHDDMDVDAGRILTGATLDTVGAEILDLMLTVASGMPTHSERHGIGEEEFNPWMLGAIL